MLRVVEALITLIRETSELSAFIGTGGPFWDIAPEGTAFPYMVIGQVGGSPNLYGFGGGSYVEPVMIRLALYGTSLESLAANAETLCETLDFADLSLGGGELCRRIMRIEAPRVAAMPVDGSGVRVYQAVMTYRMKVQRAVGT